MSEFRLILASIIFSGLFMFTPVNSIAQNVHDGSCACGRRDQIPLVMNPSGKGFWLGVEQEVADNVWNHYLPIIQMRDELISVITTGDGQHDVGMFVSKDDAAQLLSNGRPGDRVLGTTQSFFKNGPCEPDGMCPLNECNPSCRLTETNIFIYKASDLPCKRWTSFTEVWPNQRSDITPCDPHLFQAVLLHEFGHALGLRHNFNNLSVMNYVRNVAGQYVTLADVNALRARYPDLAVELDDLATYPFVFREPRFLSTVDISLGRISPGESFEITNFTIENLGTSAAEDVRLIFFMYDFNRIKDSFTQRTAFKLGEMQIPSIPVSGFLDVTTPITLTMPPAGQFPPGFYWIGAIIARGSTGGFTPIGIEDAVTYNNKWTSDFTIELLDENGMSVPFPPIPTNSEPVIFEDSEDEIEEGIGIFEVVSVGVLDDDSINDPVPEPIPVDFDIGNGDTPGDGNGDGSINVADVIVAINLILGIGEATGNADCNGDQNINVADVVCIINIILEDQ